jgi:signal transduction histidine kinase
VGPTGDVLDASPPLTHAPALLTPATVAAEHGHHHVHNVNLADPDVDLAVTGSIVHLRTGEGVVVVGVETQGFLSARREVLTLLAIGLACVTALVGIITWLLTGRALMTVSRLTAQAERLSAAEAPRGLDATRQDRELAELTDALNNMLARIGEQHARNLAAAAETTHRLRTPLATLRAEAELALTQEDPEQLRAALRAVVTDADRLRGIVDRLLRIGSSGLLPQRVSDAVEDLRGQWDRQARASGTTINVSLIGDGAVDASLLRAIIEPLVENAVAYADQGSRVDVDITADAELSVTVENCGPGVAPSVRATLFEPWVSETPGRSGLGLWLARETAREAGGTVNCEKFGPGSTRFAARLPLA